MRSQPGTNTLPRLVKEWRASKVDQRTVTRGLVAAALSMPLLLRSTTSSAQSAPEVISTRLKYVYYNDFQNGGEDRITVRSPMFWFDAPLPENLEVEGSLVLDSVSGASPLYLDTLSGASGTGIHDDRKAADLKFTKYFENFSLGVGGAYSNEHDYESRSGTLDTRLWNEDKTTVFSFGVSGDFDSIGSSNDPTLDESRKTFHGLVGVTQIINPISLIQSNITYATGDGYFTDPYKIFDNRPGSREEWAWLTRYVLYLQDIDASLHADYRLFADTWGILSHTVELQLYKPLGSYFTIRPNIRYYTQSSASFYSSTVPPLDTASLNSADQRLASFGGVSAGLKGIVKLSKDFELDVNYEYMRQMDSLGISSGENGTKPFGANYVEVGISAKF